jgi:ferredoxin
MTVFVRVTAHQLRGASSGPGEAQLCLKRPTAPLRLLDALEDEGVYVGAFSCRSARCGACLAEVHDPAALLAAPADDELSTLAELSAPPGDRLGCQLVLRAGPDGALSGALSVCFRR